METDTRLPSGEWNGFYLEETRSGKGWMHLYLKFEDGKISGEGTDYVGPWVASGSYDLDSGKCGWVKEYVGQHNVRYAGIASDKGIMGEWTILSSGPFHIWPRGMNHMHENYLKQERDMPMPVPMPSGSGNVMEPVEI